MEKLSKEELVKLVKTIRNVEYSNDDEFEELISLLERNVIDPNVGDLIFHHTPRLTDEEVVEKALAYKPILL